MITGTSQADVAILVIDSVTGEFEKGFKDEGQTKEHILLAKSLGISQIIVAINKLDREEWNENRFKEIQNILGTFLQKSGFPPSKVSWIPCSGLLGINLSSNDEEKLKSWYNGPTLLQEINNLPRFPHLYDKPLRLTISDIYKDTQNNFGITVAGKIQTGFLSKNDTVLVLPQGETCQIKAIKYQDNIIEYAFSGLNVEIGITGIQMNFLSIGSVICDPDLPVPLVKRFKAQILTFSNLKIPLLRGHQVLLHSHCLNEPAVIKKLICTLNQKTGEVEKKRPKSIGEKISAKVIIELNKPICMELYSEIRSLGRFMLRDGGKTLAAGIVTKIIE